MFADRNDAAHQLAQALARYRGQNPLVLAIPRGAVPMGKILAEELCGELDVILVRKLRAPYAAEVAIGAVDESGWTYIAPYATAAGANQPYIDGEKSQQLATIRQRRAQYTPIRPQLDVKDRIVIVVDDGLATGATMLAALHGLRQRKPAWVVCAVPVGSHDALERVKPLADEVVCLLEPENFQAVGQYYRRFTQVEDAEVIAVLKQNSVRKD